MWTNRDARWRLLQMRKYNRECGGFLTNLGRKCLYHQHNKMGKEDSKETEVEEKETEKEICETF